MTYKNHRLHVNLTYVLGSGKEGSRCGIKNWVLYTPDVPLGIEIYSSLNQL